MPWRQTARFQASSSSTHNDSEFWASTRHRLPDSINAIEKGKKVENRFRVSLIFHISCALDDTQLGSHLDKNCPSFCVLWFLGLMVATITDQRIEADFEVGELTCELRCNLTRVLSDNFWRRSRAPATPPMVVAPPSKLLSREPHYASCARTHSRDHRNRDAQRKAPAGGERPYNVQFPFERSTSPPPVLSGFSTHGGATTARGARPKGGGYNYSIPRRAHVTRSRYPLFPTYDNLTRGVLF